LGEKVKMVKMVIFFCGSLLGLLLVQCAPDAGRKAPLVVRFECETRIDESTGSPFSEVYLLVDEEKIKVADIGACDPFSPAQYADYNMPSTTLAACGGWWAGAGDYLFAVQEGDSLLVFRGWQEEGQEDEGFHYERVFGKKVKGEG
jgi:hypothetical protein